MRKIAPVFILLAVFTPFFAQAETVLRIGQDIAVAEDQMVDGDYYVSVGPLGNTTMSGSVKDDMYAFGGGVVANGSIGGDLTIIGGTSQLHATVTDDVRILGGEVTLGDHVGGDLFVVAGKLVILSTATIDGDVIFFGGDAEIAGSIGGSVLGSSERLRIDAEVGKRVDIQTHSLSVGEKAVIEGNVTYAAPREFDRAQHAVIEGDIVHKELEATGAQRDLQDALIPVFIALFASLSLFLLFKKELQSMVQDIHLHPLRSSLLGIATLLLGPVLSVVLIATVLGMLVGIAGLAASVLILAVSYAVSGIVLGAFIAQAWTRKTQVSLLSIIIGTFVLHGFLFIPLIGIPLFVLVVILAIGGVAHFFFKLLA